MPDVDFRDIPMVLGVQYNYQDYNGSKTYENSQWTFRKAFITDYRQDLIQSPTDVMRETITLIAAGRGRTFGNGNKIGVPDAIVGATYSSTSRRLPASQPAPSRATPQPLPRHSVGQLATVGSAIGAQLTNPIGALGAIAAGVGGGTGGSASSAAASLTSGVLAAGNAFLTGL